MSENNGNEALKEVIEQLTLLQDDPTVPRNVKNTISEIIKTLSEEKDISIAVHKALNALDEISEDVNIEPYTRTQLWDIASMLEKIS